VALSAIVATTATTARDVERDGDGHRNVGIWVAMLVSLSLPLSLSMVRPLFSLRQNGTTVCASRTPVIDPERVVAMAACVVCVVGDGGIGFVFVFAFVSL
jgi:hypothetical protein